MPVIQRAAESTRPVTTPTEPNDDVESAASSGLVPPPPDALPPPAVKDWFRPRDTADAPPADPPHLPGYVLRRELGRGGMGVVYEAEQLDLKRTVALKLLHAGVPLGPQQLARFRAEAEATARLCHPNVVALHELSEADGRPFLVMEYVAGDSLAARLAESPLPARDAAGLVATLAVAVDYSHRQGILHRDLKPANVLLGPDGTPKVTDFGLAKFLDADAGQTHPGTVLGTPAYAAPEQALEGGPSAGPVADVYALGVILYECLTGRPPFRAASALETLHLVRSADPVPPRRLAPRVRRDLETITLKCLRKDPRGRYATAAHLADDLHRFLDGRPILARPAGVAERFGKWCRRRPAWAALIGAALFAAGAAGTAGAAFTERLRREAERANRGEGEARRQMERADANYREARAALQRMLDRLRAGRRDVPAVKELQREQAEDALAFFRVIAAADDGRPEVRLDAARAAREAAQLQMLLGRPPEARANLGRAVDQLAALAGEFPDRPEYKAEWARALTDLGSQLTAGEPAAASAALSQAQALWEGLVAAAPGSADYRDGLATCHHTLGNYWHFRPAAAEAARHYRAAVDLRERLIREQPGNRDLRRRLAATLLNLSVQLQPDPDATAEAQAAHDRAEGHFEHLFREEPDDLEIVANLAVMRMNWAYVLANTGRADVALADLAKNVAALEPALSREPNAQHVRNALYRTYGTRAVLLGGAGRHAEAAVAWERVVSLAELVDRSTCRLSLAESLARAGDYSRAAAVAEEAVAGLPAKPGYDQFGPPAAVCALILTRLAADRTLPAAERERCSARAAALSVKLLQKARSSLTPDEWQRFRKEVVDTDGLAPLRELPECRRLLQAD
jgi:tetratricopeptide (TPR) repeat protein